VATDQTAEGVMSPGRPQGEAKDANQTTRVVVGRAALTAVLLAATVALMMALSGPGSRLEQAHVQTARLMRGVTKLPAVRRFGGRAVSLLRNGDRMLPVMVVALHKLTGLLLLHVVAGPLDRCRP